jgi:porin
MKKNLKTSLFATGTPLSLAVLLTFAGAPAAFAQSSGETQPTPNAQAAPAQQPAAGAAAPQDQASAAPAAPTGFWERSNMLGDMGGLRPWLGNYGVTFGLQETSEYMNNLSGGTHRSGAYDGVTQFGLGLDTQKAFGLPGGIFNVSGFQIHGTNLSTRNLGTLQFATGVEADASTRLWELWYQQSLLGGKVDVKVGQQSLDQEFMVSQNAGAF